MGPNLLSQPTVDRNLAYELFPEYEFARRLQEKHAFIFLSVHLSGF